MNVLSRRAVRRVGIGAVALALSAAVVGTASPAYADTTADLTLTIEGTTVAATAPGKVGSVTLGNKGPSTATGVKVTFDISGLDLAKAFVVPLIEDVDACTVAPTTVTCPVADIAKDESPEVEFLVVKKPGAANPLGKLTVSVKHEGTETDEQKADNTKTVDVVSGASGPDLVSVALDVPVNDDLVRTGTVLPGGTAPLVFIVANQGDEFVAGVKLTVKVPDHVTFADMHDACVAAADGRSAVCTFDNLPIYPVPAEEEEGEDPEKPSALLFEIIDLKVADSAPGPVNLAGGSVAVEPILAPPPSLSKLQATTPSLPEGVEVLPKGVDIDPSDNVDEYVVYVGAKPAGGGGTLPITGAKAGLIGGAGAAALVVGGLLFVMARRRRIVLMTPTDV